MWENVQLCYWQCKYKYLFIWVNFTFENNFWKVCLLLSNSLKIIIDIYDLYSNKLDSAKNNTS